MLGSRFNKNSLAFEKFLRIAFYIEHLRWLLLSDVHLGFSGFMQGSPAENLTAVHLCFSNFMHGRPAENLVAVHLGFSNFMHGCRACRHGINNKTTEKQQWCFYC